MQAAGDERMRALLLGEDEASRRGATVLSLADFQKTGRGADR